MARARLNSRLRTVANAMDVRIDAAIKDGADLIRDRAERRAPDATPFGEGLVDAIHVTHDGVGKYRVVAGDKDVFYGHMVEHGTSHSAPHPFLVPALEESREEILRNAKKAIE